MRSFLAVLVRLFPAGFRKQFEPDMVEQVQSDYDRALARSRWRACVFTLFTSLDLVRSGLSERRNPTWGIIRTPTTEDRKGTTMNGWTRDLQHAVRALRRSPGFAVVTIGTLGLAIGANAGIFSVVDTVLLDPLPYADADELVYIAYQPEMRIIKAKLRQFGIFEFFLHFGMFSRKVSWF